MSPPDWSDIPSNPIANEGKERTKGETLEIISVGELVRRVRAMPPPTFLARPVWPGEAYGVLAARWKAGKTWAEEDLAVAVASGGEWLGMFPVERPGTVLMFLGEGGERKMERRLQAIARSKGVDLEELPIHLCFRSPHLRDGGQLEQIREWLEANPVTVLVIIDPLYLAARGAKAAQLYEMGETLEGIQHVCQDAGAALMVVTHWNRDRKAGSGSDRMSGAGPAEWGRVLVSMEVRTTRTDPITKESDVTLSFQFEGDELPEETFYVRRRIRSENPASLTAPLHYRVDPIDATKVEAGESDLSTAERRILRSLLPGPATSKQIGDRLANDGAGLPFKPDTIQKYVKRLRERDLVDWDAVVPAPGMAPTYWLTDTGAEVVA